MTREEAITELNIFKIGAKSEIGENALDMAIRSLEAWDEIDNYLDSKMVDLRKDVLKIERNSDDWFFGYAHGLNVAKEVLRMWRKVVEE